MIASIENHQSTALAYRANAERSPASAFSGVMAGASANADTASISQAITEAASKPPAIENASETARSGDSATDRSAKLTEALAVFKKEASLTPAQRARRDVLKMMNLTEDAIKAMPPEQQKATEQKIAAEVARRLRLGEKSKDQIASS